MHIRGTVSGDYSGVPDTAAQAAGRQVPLYRQALVIVGAGLGLGSGFAPIYFATLAIFLKPIAAEFGWGRAQTATVGVLSMLGLAFGSVLIGRLIDKFGPARVILGSILSMAGLISLLAFVPNNPWLFAVLSFMIGCTGAATTPPGYLSVLALWFDRRLGLALGLAGVLMGVGTVVMPMLAQSLVASSGWRQAYSTLAIGAAILGVAACSLIFVQRGGVVEASHAGSDDSDILSGDAVSQALRRWRFWLLIGVVFFVSAASLGMSIHLVSLITDRGITATVAAKVAAITGVGIIAGRLISGVVVDIYPARRVAALTFSFASAGAAMLATGAATGFVGLAISVLLIGFAIGAEGDFIPFFVRRYFGLRAFGSIYGLLFFAFGVGGVVGPIAFGACFDRLGSYTVALWAATSVLIACATAIYQLGPYQFVSERGSHL